MREIVPYFAAIGICILLYLGGFCGRKKLLVSCGGCAVTVMIRAAENAENLEQVLRQAALLSDEGVEIVVIREGLSEGNFAIAENLYHQHIAPASAATMTPE